ncbi:MAG: transglycosylase domain-containing protein [Pyrinomonadaceae bacterium]
MGRFFRRSGIVVACAFTSILLWVGLIACQAFIQTPGYIEHAEKSGKLEVRVEDVPSEYLEALLTVEDPNFYQHNGVDLTTKGAGWTTITQAIVKAHFYEDFSPGFLRHRKVNQTIIALVFDARTDKHTQLRLFINTSYFGTVHGREITGFRMAAREYYEKEFHDLTKDEFLSLTAMLIAPQTYSIRDFPDVNQDRVFRIKRLLNGDCEPASHGDVYYQNCTTKLTP